jgi:hypothetical protein
LAAAVVSHVVAAIARSGHAEARRDWLPLTQGRLAARLWTVAIASQLHAFATGVVIALVCYSLEGISDAAVACPSPLLFVAKSFATCLPLSLLAPGLSIGTAPPFVIVLGWTTGLALSIGLIPAFSTAASLDLPAALAPALAAVGSCALSMFLLRANAAPAR